MGKVKETPRYNVISMRVSDEEQKDLQCIASLDGVSISEMMRRAIETYAHCQELVRDPLPAGPLGNRG